MIQMVMSVRLVIDKKVVAADAKGAKIFAPNQPWLQKLKHYDPNYVNNYAEAA